MGDIKPLRKQETQEKSRISQLPHWPGFYPRPLLILVATDENSTQRRRTLLLTLIVILLELITGDRTVPVLLILLLLASDHILGAKVNKPKALLAIITTIIIVTSVDALRTMPVNQWDSQFIIQSISTESFGSNRNNQSLPVTLLSNISNSYQTLAGTITLVPTYESYRFGLDYLRPLRNAIPFLPSISFFDIPGLKPTVWITDRLSGGWVGLGYLQVAEAYLNFGVVGVLALYALLGWGLSRLWHSLIKSVTINRQKLAYVLILMLQILTWIRNDAGNMGRTIIWGWVIIYLFPQIYNAISPQHIELERDVSTISYKF